MMNLICIFLIFVLMCWYNMIIWLIVLLCDLVMGMDIDIFMIRMVIIFYISCIMIRSLLISQKLSIHFKYYKQRSIPKKIKPY